jgi:hypothetical protein
MDRNHFDLLKSAVEVCHMNGCYPSENDFQPCTEMSDRTRQALAKLHRAARSFFAERLIDTYEEVMKFISEENYTRIQEDKE